MNPNEPLPPRKIGVVACCGKKLDKPTPARSLYQSLLFRLSKAYVERTCDDWCILSAKHHVVQPGVVLSPYDQDLNDLNAFERRAWSLQCRGELMALYPDSTFVVLAGWQYVCAVVGLPHTAPLNGLGIGKRIQWLKRALVEEPA